MKLYLYIRLSSADDDLKYKSESESIVNQRALLRQFVESRREFYGWDIKEFVDDGYTGTNDDRPAFNRMIEHLKDGDAQLVICKDFSRFFRDYTEIGDYLERIFPFRVYVLSPSMMDMTAMITKGLPLVWRWS